MRAIGYATTFALAAAQILEAAITCRRRTGTKAHQLCRSPMISPFDRKQVPVIYPKVSEVWPADEWCRADASSNCGSSPGGGRGTPDGRCTRGVRVEAWEAAGPILQRDVYMLGEANYLERRATAALELAQRATHRAAVKAHCAMADAYLARLYPDPDCDQGQGG